MRTPQLSRISWPPSPGFFTMKLCRDGWPVPCRIIQHENGWWQAVVDGEALEPHSDPQLAARVGEIWQGCPFASETDYNWRMQLKVWAPKHDPHHPCLSPRQPMHPNRLKPFID